MLEELQRKYTNIHYAIDSLGNKHLIVTDRLTGKRKHLSRVSGLDIPTIYSKKAFLKKENYHLFEN